MAESSTPRRQRWAFNVAAWQPAAADFQTALHTLPGAEQAACTRFHRLIDQKRALVSRTLQRKLGAQVLGMPAQDVQILRTERGKPFFAELPDAHAAPSCNFSVSHEVRRSVCLGTCAPVITACAAKPIHASGIAFCQWCARVQLFVQSGLAHLVWMLPARAGGLGCASFRAVSSVWG